MAYTDEQIDHLEQRLLRDRERVVRKLMRYGDEFTRVAAGGAEASDAFSFHIADEGTETAEREKAFLLAGEEARVLAAIDAALRRLYRDRSRYGLCLHCGREVGFIRLDALPYAERCIDCQTRRERGELDE